MSKRKHPYKTSIKNTITMLERQNYRCYYCNSDINSKNASCEHIEAYSKVGKVHCNNNIAISCKTCNRLKGDISEELFRDGYICVNIKPGFDLQSYNKPEKVRRPKKWYHGNIIKWNKGNYKLTKKLYD